MRIILVACAAVILAASPGQAIEPRSIKAAKQIKPDHGAVRLSVQSQVQQGGTIHLWFVREGGDPSRSSDVLKFERKQGVPLLGTNTVDSRPLVYTVPAGRYRLLGYGVACAGVPVPGTYGCTGTLNGIPLGTTPARSYDGGEVPSFEVISGSLTDAGEFILEADPNSPISEEDALRHLQKNHRAYDVRIRPIAEAVPVAFSALGKGPQAIVPTEFQSKISCRHRPEGAMMYLPFQC